MTQGHIGYYIFIVSVILFVSYILYSIRKQTYDAKRAEVIEKEKIKLDIAKKIATTCIANIQEDFRIENIITDTINECFNFNLVTQADIDVLLMKVEDIDDKQKVLEEKYKKLNDMLQTLLTEEGDQYQILFLHANEFAIDFKTELTIFENLLNTLQTDYISLKSKVTEQEKVVDDLMTKGKLVVAENLNKIKDEHMSQHEQSLSVINSFIKDLKTLKDTATVNGDAMLALQLDSLSESGLVFIKNSQADEARKLVVEIIKVQDLIGVMSKKLYDVEKTRQGVLDKLKLADSSLSALEINIEKIKMTINKIISSPTTDALINLKSNIERRQQEGMNTPQDEIGKIKLELIIAKDKVNTEIESLVKILETEQFKLNQNIPDNSPVIIFLDITPVELTDNNDMQTVTAIEELGLLESEASAVRKYLSEIATLSTTLALKMSDTRTVITDGNMTVIGIMSLLSQLHKLKTTAEYDFTKTSEYDSLLYIETYSKTVLDLMKDVQAKQNFQTISKDARDRLARIINIPTTETAVNVNGLSMTNDVLENFNKVYSTLGHRIKTLTEESSRAETHLNKLNTRSEYVRVFIEKQITNTKDKVIEVREQTRNINSRAPEQLSSLSRIFNVLTYT